MNYLSLETSDHAFGLIMLAWAIWVWGNGLIGMMRTRNIHRTYGTLISGGWAVLRLLRAFVTASMLAVIVSNALTELAGIKTELLFSNILGFVLMIFLNWLVITGDKKRFYGRCNRQLARQIIRAERQMAYSIVTRLCLIFTIGTIATLFEVTDTADYYLGKDGKIYRRKDMLSL